MSRDAESIARNLEEWANWIHGYVMLVRPGTGRLHDAPTHLRDAAAWIRERHPVPAPPAAQLPAGHCSMGMSRPPQ